ncbi:MAG: ATP-binding protein [Nitrosomonas sp.]|nr:ATP-binding protein [Nitrosomonas sp.]MCW5608385.1 ATP-binding protein [Nitrosomonas sp.]
MNTQTTPFTVSANERSFSNVAQTAAEHFRLSIFGVIAHLIEVCMDGDRAAALTAYPFLADYADELAARLQPADSSSAQWRTALSAWESKATVNLPLLALRRAGLSRLELELVLITGLLEEDPRFAVLFEQVTGGSRRPTAGLLIAWWRSDAAGQDYTEAVRRSMRSLVHAGLLQVLNPGMPGSEWVLAVPPPIWDGLRGEPPELPWLRYVPQADLLPLSRYIAPPSVAHLCDKLPPLLAAQPGQLLIVRGPRRNGRKTLAGSVAHALDKAMLNEESHWRLLGVLAVMLDAFPVIELALSPGENRTLPPLPLLSGPLAVVMGMHGGIHGDDTRTSLTVTIPMPDAALRRLHWQDTVSAQHPAILDDLAQSVCLTSGNIRRAARAALGYAQLDGRSVIEHRDVQLACRGLHSARLETLATRLETRGSLDDLAVDETTHAELKTLMLRCRYREPLAAASHHGGGCSTGVRALFSGPSGTGKTLAARLLASALGKDLYRVDLSATVNKYLGETEKSLDQVFSAAEELDVILLLDEGDALMASRTDVSSSNDRYANLETNFLLQRIEAFNGILLVTTNVADRIDKAFARRIEVIVRFRAPDQWQRYQILRMHLGSHAVDDGWLQEVACRCELTGGQLRNVVMHARLLAMDVQEPIRNAHLHAALQREYRKTGAHCPLKPLIPPDIADTAKVAS